MRILPACQEMMEEAKVIPVVITNFLISKSLSLYVHILLPRSDLHLQT